MALTTAPCEAFTNVIFINPGPAISILSIISFDFSDVVIISAICLGGFPALFASASAIEVA